MKDIIVNKINELKHYTKTSIQKLSKENIPFRSDIDLIEKYYYKIEGKIYSSPHSKIFMSIELPYTSIENSLPNVYSIPFKEAVEAKDIYPLLIFINGKFIKWSDITLVKDVFYSYLIIANINSIDDKFDIHTITIPEIKITYKENNSTLDSNCIFFFDSNTDLYVSSPQSDKIYTTISIDNDNDINLYKNSIYSNNRFYIPLDQKVEVFNMFVFNNGLLYNPDKVECYPLNIFNVVTTSKVFVSVLCFTFKRSNNCLDLETDIVNKTIAINRILSKQNESYFNNISERFDFSFNANDSETNMNNTLQYIMDYNPSLMNSIYKDISGIKSKIINGSDLLNVVRDDGFVHLSRRYNDKFDCYFIIFKNGYLYDQYKTGRYVNSEFLFRLENVKPTDIFEILYLLDIDNRIDEMRMWSGEDDTVYLDPTIDIENMIIASPTPHNHNFDFERNNNIVYNVDFEAERVSTDRATIILKDSFYYDKLLYIGSKKQFRYFCKYNQDDEPKTDFVLPDTFKLCNDINCYMIFINGIYIDKSLYSITIFNEYDPFYRLGLYLDIAVNKDDRLEVLYIGNILTKVYENDSKIKNSGNILLDSSKLMYPFDYQLYMIFVDGRKSLPEEIINIDSKRFSMATTSNNIIKRVSIIQFIKEDSTLYSYFKDNDDLLSTINASLSDADLSALFSSQSVNTENPDLTVDLEDRMLRIVKDYWAKSYINNGDEIPISFEGYYENGQIIDTGNLS